MAASGERVTAGTTAFDLRGGTGWHTHARGAQTDRYADGTAKEQVRAATPTRGRRTGEMRHSYVRRRRRGVVGRRGAARTHARRPGRVRDAIAAGRTEPERVLGRRRLLVRPAGVFFFFKQKTAYEI